MDTGKKSSNYPYDDPSIHQTVQPLTDKSQHQEPFNDAMGHFNAVQGNRWPSHTDEYPSRPRKWFRLISIISVLTIAGGLVYSLVESMIFFLE